jgi:hypothetical protein
MAKAKTGAKAAQPAKKKPVAAKASAKSVPAKAAAGKTAKAVTGKKAAVAAPVKAAKATAPKAPAAKAAPAPAPAPKSKGKSAAAAPAQVAAKAKALPSPFEPPVPDKPKPRASKLPIPGPALTKREMEQILTAGVGRGVGGEGSLKGRLVVKEGFPYLHVTGRDKRELVFLLQGPDQEVLPAYGEHKLSVSGLIRKTTNYGGTVDVRKYVAKRADAEPAPEAVAETKLRFLSPGEVEQIINPGMGAGMKGFAALRGSLEMNGESFILVVSNGGTRQQVSFLLEGKSLKSARKFVGHTLQATGVIDKESGWGGRINVELFEARAPEVRVARSNLEVTQLQVDGDQGSAEVRLNQGLTVRLPEKAGYTWAIEPTAAKRVGLREAHFELTGQSAPAREFFFTPRNPGTFEVDFFLAKAFQPAQVSKTYRLGLMVKSEPLGIRS